LKHISVYKYALQTDYVYKFCVCAYIYVCMYTHTFREEGFPLLPEIKDWKNYADSCSAKLTC